MLLVSCATINDLRYNWHEGCSFEGMEPSPKQCKVDGCERSALPKDNGAKGWCCAHYGRAKKHGDPQAHIPIRDGSGCKASGYLMFSIKKKKVLAHRLIMEQHLGRPLLPFPLEIVHHINGDPLDNRIENLQLKSQSSHIKEHSAGYKDDNAKTCTRCSRLLPRSEFYRNGPGKTPGSDPHNTRCKECIVAVRHKV